MLLFWNFDFDFTWHKMLGFKYAVVIGVNKGIRFGICKQLASNGIIVVLTAREEKRGLKVVEKLGGLGLSDFVFFH